METNRTFTRAEIKQRAKQSLKGRWDIAIATVLLSVVLSLLMNLYIENNITPFLSSTLLALSLEPLYDVFMLISALLGIALAMAILPITCGFTSINIKISRNEPAKYSDIFKPYNYTWKVVSLGLLIMLKTILWSLLFIIPGIIASLRYSQSIYILIDDPEKSASQCINESCEMMRGKKADLFVLGLSFIGWILLTLITFGIAGLYVMPYMDVTYANFYNQLANKVPAENFGASEEGFTIQEPATDAEVDQNEFVAPEPVVMPEPEVTPTCEVVTEPETTSDQEYGFEVEEDK